MAKSWVEAAWAGTPADTNCCWDSASALSPKGHGAALVIVELPLELVSTGSFCHKQVEAALERQQESIFWVQVAHTVATQCSGLPQTHRTLPSQSKAHLPASACAYVLLFQHIGLVAVLTSHHEEHILPAFSCLSPTGSVLPFRAHSIV